ncbi:MAG: hypothetical protein GWO20_13065 [Candidatus Korarchaeota archaeon]|nr:hypothetical protein [Candidatus Korarchaeota archaeon]NIU84348.1 hypothetical protein [Candidatus Thorarchaeota archaeon]NIW14465.1 hypothetical protein [Candidatus Thorarchaeota archaeon]NIW52542.1 hypothetical protein [Candidatus Korarchaeota archaeon]
MDTNHKKETDGSNGRRIPQAGGERKRIRFKSELIIMLQRENKSYTVIGDVGKAKELYRKEIYPRDILLSDEVFVDLETGKRTSKKIYKN